METKKYTNHSFLWIHIATFIVFTISFMLDITMTRKPSNTLFIVLVLLCITLIVYLVLIIKEGLAWNSYLEISDEGVKMKGCAKRISDNKKENVDDIFIPWGDIEEVKRGPYLVLKTGEKIKLTQEMEVNFATFQNAFDQYKFKQLNNDSDQLEITSVISAINNDDKAS